MSLINDALKRAGQKSASTPSASEVAAGLQPTEEQRPNGFPVLSLVIVLIPLIALGVWFMAKGLELKERRESPEPVETAAARAPEAVAAPDRALTSLRSEASARQASAATNIAAPQPGYKLQGIYWRPSKPSVVINGKTVYVGGRVDNARVTAIDQESVTIMVDGKSQVLLLP